MAQNSAIEWTETTWNPLTGCTKISPGCRHFYAERMALRLQAMGQANYAKGFDLTLHEHMLEVPLRFLSLEPLLGPLPDLDLEGVDWVIVDGESGPGRGRWRSSG